MLTPAEFHAPSLERQLTDARDAYRHARSQVQAVCALYEQVMIADPYLIDDLNKEAPRPAPQQLRTVLDDWTYWDAEAEAAEIRLASIGKVFTFATFVGRDWQ